MKTKLALIGLIALLIISLCGTIKYAQHQKSIANRQQNNIYSLLEDVSRYKIRGDSIEIASVRQMELKKREFEHLMTDNARLIKELKIKPKNTTKYIEVKSHATDTIHVVIIDSSFTYRDNWLSLNGRIFKDSVSVDYILRSEINIIEHRKPKRFLGFLWNTKKTEYVRCEVVSFNPRDKIESVQSIKII